MERRLLTSLDEAPLEAFLANHRDSSMFLRANARHAGLVYQQKPFHATYAAALHEGAVIGVAAHGWDGMVLLQAPAQTAELARDCVEWSGRPVTGLSGPLGQVRQARPALGLAAAQAALEGDEWLYALDLAGLTPLAPRLDRTITCRAPLPAEHETLCAWRIAYDVETLGVTDSPEHRRRAADFLDAQIAEGNAWVALDGGVPVSLAAFNASLPDMVQLGGIYTPPQFRGRGYAKVVVGASLVVARERGASRAVLFTKNPSAARTYDALGFRRVGDFSLVLFR
jgi:uncharacterized protein